ncbi:DegT/DnrJ/EryC1/StrS family aminotransferase [Pseudomonadales bacterium]|nr:DegT/DnrJ/EryC1/StrS family aminotransferase [Pseudomonadales bacterium]
MSEYSAPTQFIDLAAQQHLIRSEIDVAIKKVLDHGQYIMGPEVKEFEQQLCSFTGSSHALSCANGTDALTLVLMAWGVGPGDAVFVPSFTYVATAEAPAQLGATPFFVDVCEKTFNMCPQSLKQGVEDCCKLGLQPSVVIPVDLFGRPADIDPISSIAEENGLKILIDGAQSFGGSKRGRAVGTMGDATTTSFFPAKPLGCYGDGGAIFTDNSDLAETINSIRLHGKGSQKYDNVRVGLNSRLDTIQAAILLEKLKIFPKELELRREVAGRYIAGIENKNLLPLIDDDTHSVWAQFTLKTKIRDVVQSELKKNKIPSVIYYPIPLTKQVGYSDFPVVSSGANSSLALSQMVLSLPMHPYLSEQEQGVIINEVNKLTI